jgi:hypothetical protein
MWMNIPSFALESWISYSYLPCHEPGIIREIPVLENMIISGSFVVVLSWLLLVLLPVPLSPVLSPGFVDSGGWVELGGVVCELEPLPVDWAVLTGGSESAPLLPSMALPPHAVSGSVKMAIIANINDFFMMLSFCYSLFTLASGEL